MIPLTVITGFLGSGKTTLISRLLRDPAFARTAVIVNEFGEIGLDHDLVASSDDRILTLNTGCLCCAVQTDLASTLLGLLTRRSAGLVCYDRVVIETSGLSDPAPVLQSILTDRDIAGTHAVPHVITLVDTIHGEATLSQHIEARHQVALADRIIFSKTDLRSPSPGLVAAVDALNQTAARGATISVEPQDTFDGTNTETFATRLGRIKRRHGHTGIDTVSILRDRALPALALTLLLQALAEHCGPRLLRLKGLVAIEEMPGQPAVIHGVRHVVSPPDFLVRWPTPDTRTRIVLITRQMPRYFVPRLLDAIEEEVRDVTADPLGA